MRCLADDVPEIVTHGRTLRSWRREILAHYATGASIARAAQRNTQLMRDSFVYSAEPDGSRPWTPNRVTKRFIRARSRAGLAHFPLHELRHFMATQMLAAGAPVASVSARLSHARASTTLNVYAHVVPGADRDAAEILSSLLVTARSGRGSDA